MRHDAIGNLLEHLLGPSWQNDERFLKWPPDAFAVAATLLYETGAYINVVRGIWPPSGPSLKSWRKRTVRLDKEWCNSAGANPRKDPPKQILKWWHEIKAQASKGLEACGQEVVCHKLLELLATADEASAGAGVPRSPRRRKENRFRDKISMKFLPSLFPSSLLLPPSTLCQNVHPTKAIVLPKMRTPQSCITIRSLSHHLALVKSCGVKPVWMEYKEKHSHNLNLLLIPFPTEVSPRQFHAVPTGKNQMPEPFRYFKYEPDAQMVSALIDRL